MSHHMNHDLSICDIFDLPASGVQSDCQNGNSNFDEVQGDVFRNCTQSPSFKIPLTSCLGKKNKTSVNYPGNSLFLKDSGEVMFSCELSSTPVSSYTVNRCSSPVPVAGPSDVVESLSTFLDNAELSWTSSMATPDQARVLSTTLNTEERKVLLPNDGDGSDGSPHPGTQFLTSRNLFPKERCEQSWHDLMDVAHGEEDEEERKIQEKDSAIGRNHSHSSESQKTPTPFHPLPVTQDCIKQDLGNASNRTCGGSVDSPAHIHTLNVGTVSGDETRGEEQSSSPEVGSSPSLIKGCLYRHRKNFSQKCPNIFQKGNGFTQHFSHDLSASMLEEVCQATELMDAMNPDASLVAKDMISPVKKNPSQDQPGSPIIPRSQKRRSKPCKKRGKQSFGSEVYRKKLNTCVVFEEISAADEDPFIDDDRSGPAQRNEISEVHIEKFKGMMKVNPVLYSVVNKSTNSTSVAYSNCLNELISSSLTLELAENVRKSGKYPHKNLSTAAEGFIPFTQLVKEEAKEKELLFAESLPCLVTQCEVQKGDLSQQTSPADDVDCSSHKHDQWGKDNNPIVLRDLKFREQSRNGKALINYKKIKTPNREVKCNFQNSGGLTQKDLDKVSGLPKKVNECEKGGVTFSEGDARSSSVKYSKLPFSNTQVDDIEHLMILLDEEHSLKTSKEDSVGNGNTNNDVDCVEHKVDSSEDIFGSADEMGAEMASQEKTSSQLQVNELLMQNQTLIKEVDKQIDQEPEENQGEDAQCHFSDSLYCANLEAICEKETAVDCFGNCVLHSLKSDLVEPSAEHMKCEERFGSVVLIQKKEKCRNETGEKIKSSANNGDGAIKPAGNLMGEPCLLEKQSVVVAKESLNKAENLFYDDSVPLKSADKNGFLSRRGREAQRCQETPESDSRSFKLLESYQRQFNDDEFTAMRASEVFAGSKKNMPEQSSKMAKDLCANDNTPLRPSDSDVSLMRPRGLFNYDFTPLRPSESDRPGSVPEKPAQKPQKLFADDSTPSKHSEIEVFLSFGRRKEFAKTVDLSRVPVCEKQAIESETLSDIARRPVSPSHETKGFSSFSEKRELISVESLQRKLFDDENSSVRPPNKKDFPGGKRQESVSKTHNFFGDEATPLRPPEQIGFSSINSAKISVFEESLKKPSKLLVGDSGLRTEPSLTTYSRTDGKKLIVPEESIKDIDMIGQNDSTPGKPCEFVGFSTASGKKVTFSEEALLKAQKLLEDSISTSFLEHQNFTTSEKKMSAPEKSFRKATKLFNGDSCTLNLPEVKGFSTASGKRVSVSEEALRKAQNLFVEDVTPVRAAECKGFSTASGKKVSVSEEALRKAQNLFVEDVTPVRAAECKGFSTASGKKVPVSEEALRKAHNLFVEDVTPLRPAECKGFSTASGKKVTVSEEALRKAQNLFVEDVTPLRPAECKGFSTASGKKVSVSEEALRKAQNLFVEDVTPVRPAECKGFSTASGKKVSVSEEALRKAQNLFVEDVTPVRAAECKGFSTASGKKVSVSEEALRKAQNLFVEDVTPVRPAECKGFSTASGKKVSVSEEALRKAQNLFVEDVTPGRPAECKGFSTASGKKVSVSEEALRKAQNLFVEDVTPVRPAECKGFSTASGKKVSVSEEALRKAQNLFVEDVTPVRPAECKGFSTASGKKVSVSEEALRKAQNLFVEDVTPVRPAECKGFSTASGKKVSVSEEALRKAQNLFVEDVTPVRPAECKGFSTASGKKVSVSEEALRKAQNLFVEDVTPVRPAECKGFSTASGKKVSVSEEALRKAQNLFVEDVTPVRPAECKGFSTASGKKVSVSEEALRKAQNLFVEDVTPVRPAECKGFSTASGKKVSVSEEALRKAQNLFVEDVTPVRAAECKRFCTASGKKVSVSEEALRKAQNLFVEDVTPVRPAECKGFSTASGKKVSVSEEALRKAQNLFVEDVAPVRPAELPGLSTACGPKMSVFEDSLDKAQKLSTVADTRSSENLGQRETKGILPKSLTIHSSTPLSSCHVVAKDCDTVENSLKRRAVNELGIANRKLARATVAGIEVNTPTAPLAPRRRNLRMNLEGTVSGSEAPVSERGDKSLSESTLREEKMLLNANDSDIDDICHDLMNNSFSEKDQRVKKQQPMQPRDKKQSNVAGLTQEVRECMSALLADEEEVEVEHRHAPAPAWAHSLLSCPDMMHDREWAPAPFLTEAGDAPNTVSAGPISAPLATPGSPVLGRSDRFQRLRRVGRRLRLQQRRAEEGEDEEEEPAASQASVLPRSQASILPPSQPGAWSVPPASQPANSTFKVPYKQGQHPPATAGPVTPKRPTLSPCFGAPFFKKARTLKVAPVAKPSLPAEDVAAGRARAAKAQQAAVEAAQGAVGEMGSRPCEGSLLLRRQTEHGQRLSLRLATRGRPPERHLRRALLRFGMKESVINVTAANTSEFKFRAWEFYSPKLSAENIEGIPVGDGATLVLDADSQAGVVEVTRAFLASPCIDPRLVPKGWVENHYRWLVWKLAAMEKSFPHLFAGRCLTPNVLMLQLKYRYDREIDLCQRPALRRILEKDDSAGKRLVLCVAAVFSMHPKNTGEGKKEVSSNETADTNSGPLGPEYELLLTDGWYSIRAIIDHEMCNFVRKGLVAIGTKLMTHGAELLNCDNACPPLEAPPSVRLKLHTNSTRRARWDAKLGYQPCGGPFTLHLNTVLPQGGSVSCLQVAVSRVYPQLYLEKLSSGKSLLRTERMERRVAAQFEQKLQRQLEQLYSQERAKFSQENRQRRRVPAQQLAKITSGPELCELLYSDPDPTSLQALLNDEQQQLVKEFGQGYRDQMVQQMEERIRERIGEDGVSTRSVTNVLKVRCLDARTRDCNRTAVLSMWRPSEEVTQMLREGGMLKLFNVTANGVRFGSLQLSAGRQTRYCPVPLPRLMPYYERRVTRLSEAASRDFHPPFNEIDVVGVVVHVGFGSQRSSRFETVYIADADMVLLGISFWGGVQEFGWEDLLKPLSCVAAANLQWRQNARPYPIPCAYASEYSVFSKSPKHHHLQEALENLQQNIRLDMRNFVAACKEVLHTRLKGVSGTNPNGRISRPLDSGVRPRFELQDSVIESEVDTPVHERLRKLGRIGNPPPISPLFIPPHPASLKKEFTVPKKVPLPSPKKSILTSPAKEDCAEESPPLSLDEPD